MNKEKIKLFLVDDDAVFLKSLEIEFLQNADFIIDDLSELPALIFNRD